MVDPQLALDILELVLGPLEILLSVLVYWAAPKSPVNRILAVLLLLEGLTFGGLLNASESFASPRFVTAAMALVILDIYIAAPLYLLFITYAINTPITQKIRGWPAIIGCAGLATASIVQRGGDETAFCPGDARIGRGAIRSGHGSTDARDALRPSPCLINHRTHDDGVAQVPACDQLYLPAGIVD